MPDLLEQLRTAFVGRYAIERELGHGGMALVFLAQDLKHHRPVAIKILRPELAQALGTERFLREIEIAARLTHPHILPLYDSGEAGGFLYYVMPYIEGESLRDRLNKAKQLPVDEALHIATQVASALSYAHSHDVVHRDIKPENVLLAGDEVVVADFGIARAITAAGGDQLTSTGIAVGTPAYMSPEQGAGEPHLDGRSDVFSLGCVMYEMLAGEPPFTGPTVQAIQARRMTDPVPPLQTLRETVPVHVEQAIVKALAKVPADRFARATEFAEALTRGVGARRSADPARRFVRFALGGTTLLAAGLVAALVVFRSGRARSLNSDLLAVAPFNVHGGSINAWDEGLVEYLSRSLDGAGDLRTVSPSVFLRNWRGRADPASARALGRRTGAGLVVFGSLIQGSRDSVRLQATLLDVANGRSRAEVEVAGDTLGMDRVVDSLAVGLLRGLGRTRPVGAVRDAPFGVASLPAIKEFLQGERFYRRRQFDSVLAHDAHAIALDSSLALAYHRMSLVLSWNPPSENEYAPAETYAFKAAALNHGLASRDSLLVAADSCFFALSGFASDDSVYAALDLRQRLFTRLIEGTRRFPGDPEVWIELGEARYWLEPFDAPTEALRAFDRAIALDSGFTPAYEHVLQLALEIGGQERARSYARTYLALNPSGTGSPSIRLAALMLDPVRSRSPETARLIDTVGVLPLWQAGLEHLGYWADSAETAVSLLRAVAVGRRAVTPDVPWVADTLMWPQYLATTLLYRGHVREAYRVFRPQLANSPDPRWALFSNPFRDLALIGAVPADTVTAVIERSLASDVASWRRWLPWWLAQRDTTALTRAVREADRAFARSASGLTRMRARSMRSSSVAYLALARGDTASAIRGLEAMPDSYCQCAMQKLTLAQLLVARGNDRSAGLIIDRWVWSLDGPFFTIARLERARIAERAGDRELAIREYRFVTDVWQNADPELQGYVADAREGLRRLSRK